MARGRFIKPEFWKDEDLAQVSFPARLLFVGLWSLADRAGRLEDRPLRIKAEIFPYDSLDLEALLAELARTKVHGNGAFIVRYESNGKRVIQIANFERHQKCHPREPESELPGPAAAVHGQPRKETARTPESESESESVGRKESVSYLPPPTERAERAVNDTVRSLHLRLAEIICKLAEHPKSRRMVPDWSREVTAYERQDGTRVRGVPDWRTIYSIDRLERSISDAKWHLAELDKEAGSGT